MAEPEQRWIDCDTCGGTGEIDDTGHPMHPNNTHDGEDETWCLDCDGDGGRFVMAEPEYQSVFAHWADGIGFNGAICCTTREAADACAIDGDKTIELIPRPVHERLVAEAVAAERAAERERCAVIIDKAYCANTDEAMRWSKVAKRIREVPQ